MTQNSAKTFQIGGHVRWNSEAGYVSGIIIRIHTEILTTKDIHTMQRLKIRSMK